MQIVSSYGVEIKQKNIPLCSTLDIFRKAVSYLIPVYAETWKELSEIRNLQKRFNEAEHLVHETKKNHARFPFDLFPLWSIRNRSCFSLRKPCCRTAVRQYPHQLFFRDPYRCRLSLCLFSMVPEMGDQQCHACHLLSADRRGFCPVPKSVRN